MNRKKEKKMDALKRRFMLKWEWKFM